MEEQLDLFEELRELRPFTTDSNYDTPEKYLKYYFANRQPSTKFQGGAMHCHAGCFRSFFDLYYLTRARFSNVTLEDVAKILIKLCEDYGNSRVSVFYNTDVEKVVFGNFENTDRSSSLIFDKSYRMFDIYGIDNLSFLDIVSLAGKKLRDLIAIQTLPTQSWEQIR